jgi:hypothetical protein
MDDPKLTVADVVDGEATAPFELKVRERTTEYLITIIPAVPEVEPVFPDMSEPP